MAGHGRADRPAMAVDAGLWPPRRPLADLLLRADARGRDGCVREELAAGVVQSKPKTVVEATSILPSLNGKTAHWRRGILPFNAPRAGGAYDSHHRTAGIAGRTRRRGCRVAARGTRAAGGDAGRWVPRE